MTRLTMLAFVLAACGNKAQPTAEATDKAPAAPEKPAPKVAAPAEAPPCPKDPKARVAAILGVKEVDRAVCATGHFPAPGWAIHAMHYQTQQDGTVAIETFAITDAAG